MARTKQTARTDGPPKKVGSVAPKKKAPKKRKSSPKKASPKKATGKGGIGLGGKGLSTYRPEVTAYNAKTKEVEPMVKVISLHAQPWLKMDGTPGKTTMRVSGLAADGTKIGKFIHDENEFEDIAFHYGVTVEDLPVKQRGHRKTSGEKKERKPRKKRSSPKKKAPKYSCEEIGQRAFESCEKRREGTPKPRKKRAKKSE